AKDDGLAVEVLDLRTLLPMDDAAIMRTVQKTNKVLIVHEDTRTGGLAGEIAARINEQAFAWLDGPIMRVTAHDVPLPYAPTLEDFVLPQTEDIVKAAAPGPAASPAAPTVAAAQRAPAAPGGAAVSPPSPTAPSRPLPPSTAPVVGKGDGGVETAEERLRRKSTPLVRKIAAEHQVDISAIPGSGFAGRVTKQDILGFIERGVPAPTAPVSRL